MEPDHKSNIDLLRLSLYSITFLVFLIWHLYREGKKNKNWLRIDVFFLLGFLIVHFQWAIMYAFSDIIPENPSRVWVNPVYVNYGIWLSVIGGLSWIFGYSILKNNKKKRTTHYKFNYNKLLNFTIILFALFLISAGKDFFSGGVYKGSGGKAYGEGISAYIQLLFSICIIIVTLFVIIDNQKNYKSNLLKWVWGLNKKYLLIAGGYIFLFLSIGDRDGPLALILTFLILTGSIIRPFKLRELIFIVSVGAVIMTLIGLGRNVNSDRSVIISGYQQMDYNSAYEPTLELANSVRTLFQSLTTVPVEHDFFYGKLWLSDLMSPIPFMQAVYLGLTDDNIFELSSTGYITYLVYGNDSTSGEGTTLIADIYLNLGLPGIIILMFLFGLLIKKANIELIVHNNYRWIIIACILASFSIYFGRSSYLIILRPIVWSYFIVFLFVKKYRMKA